MLSSFEATTENLIKHITLNTKLNYVSKDGSTLRQRNNKLKRELLKGALTPSMKASIEKKLEGDKEIELNDYERWLVGNFWQLHTGRSYGQFGPTPISFTDIQTYCEVMDAELEPVEVQILKAVDGTYIDTLVTEKNNEST